MSMRSVWHKSAPPAVRRAFQSADDSNIWRAWAKHLAKRVEPVGLSELLPGENRPLLWAPPDAFDGRGAPDIIDRLQRLCRKGRPEDSAVEGVLLTWLADAAGSRPDSVYALEALAWCHALPCLAGPVSADLWWDLLDHLLGAVAEAGQIEFDDDPLVHQLLAGELPLTLAWLFPEISPARKLARKARKALSAGPVELCDGEGIPEAKHLGLLRPLLACWTRCCAIGEALGKSCFDESAGNQYEWFVRAALRFARHDGTQVFSDGPSGAWCPALFKAALRFGGDDADRDIARLILPPKKRKKGNRKQINQPHLPDPAVHSGWAAATVLRPDWSRLGPRLTVLFPSQEVHMELECKGDVLWSGRWELEVRRDGEPAAPKSDWEEVCWVSDEDADYLELEIDLADGLRVQRQILLAREDGFLFLADVILGSRPGKLEYRSCLPLASGISFAGAGDTREGFLVGRRRRALVLPLALPEWRCDRRTGLLGRTDGHLELRQPAEGRSMFAPLLFDLQPRRRTPPLTWRRLTGAESLEIQPDDVAVGYRVKIGREQLLVYRSLAQRANRTLLGHNLSTEMLVARFDQYGEVDPLLEIE